MRKIIYVLALLGVFVTGCNDSTDTNITGPPTAQDKFGLLTNLLDNTPSVTSYIDGSKGGTIYLSGSSLKNGSLRSVSAQVEFAPGAFDGKQLITVTANFDSVSISFSPHLVFSDGNHVKLSATFTGVNLNVLQVVSGTLSGGSNGIYFCYFADDNSYEIIPNDGIGIDYLLSQISVSNARLSHFSRYIWATRR